MKTPKKLKDYPKQVRPSKMLLQALFAKHLPLPISSADEVMQVAPAKEQVRCRAIDHSFKVLNRSGDSDDAFRSKFVVVYRNPTDDNARGEKYVFRWNQVEPIE